MYCAMAPKNCVVHLMGSTTENRHLIVANELSAFGTPWSIHAGAGIRGYIFIRVMAGDNMDFTNTDILLTEALI